VLDTDAGAVAGVEGLGTLAAVAAVLTGDWERRTRLGVVSRSGDRGVSGIVGRLLCGSDLGCLLAVGFGGPGECTTRLELLAAEA
jgi:hypothetical protein